MISVVRSTFMQYKAMCHLLLYAQFMLCWISVILLNDWLWLRTICHNLEMPFPVFHKYHEIFILSGVWKDFLVQRQHALIHYPLLIHLFGAPNGLCLSITESKHIRAVKEPWQWSSWHEALGQMLVTNQWLDQLAAAQSDFTNQGMLNRPLEIKALETLSKSLSLRCLLGGSKLLLFQPLPWWKICPITFMKLQKHPLMLHSNQSWMRILAMRLFVT